MSVAEAFSLDPDPVALVASEVRGQMGRRRVNAAQMCRDLGWSTSYLSRRLSGQHPFNVAELSRIARYLGCEVRDFMPESVIRWIVNDAGLASVSLDPGQMELPYPSMNHALAAVH